MSAKIIKLTDNNNVTLIPVTDASVVQMSVDGQVKSVKDVILENEEVTAAGYNELNDRVEVLEDAGLKYTKYNAIDITIDNSALSLTGGTN